MNTSFAKYSLSQVRHPELVEGSVQPVPRTATRVSRARGSESYRKSIPGSTISQLVAAAVPAAELGRKRIFDTRRTAWPPEGRPILKRRVGA